MQNLLRFHGAHAKRIHEIDPKALVTVGAWSEFTLTNNETFGGFNFYKDECMRLASGDEDDDNVCYKYKAVEVGCDLDKNSKD